MTPFRIGWIGCGRVVQECHVPAMRYAPAHLVAYAAADPDRERCDAVANALGISPGRCYPDYCTLLAQEPLDAVVVATPHAIHAESIRDALDAGLAVLSEKPLTPTGAEAKLLVAKAIRTACPLGVIHNYAYAPLWRRAFAIIERRSLGLPRSMRVDIRAPGPLPGFFRGRPEWRLDPDLGVRGCLLDQGYHFFYLAMALFAEVPWAVEAVLERRQGLLDDRANVALRFSSGRTCNIAIDWTAATELLTAYEIDCDVGRMCLDEDQSCIEVIDGKGGRTTENIEHNDDPGGFRGGLVDWLDCAGRGEKPPGMEAGVAVLELIDKCYGVG